jgi:hypothetical protein
VGLSTLQQVACTVKQRARMLCECSCCPCINFKAMAGRQSSACCLLRSMLCFTSSRRFLSYNGSAGILPSLFLQLLPAASR